MAVDPNSDSLLARTRAVLGITVQRAYRDEIFVHAAALTYYSLLSIVPLLALVFAIVKALGGVEDRLDALIATFTADPAVTQRIVDFVRQAHVGALTGLSSAFLLYTAWVLLGSIEKSFNRIWRVRRGREWWRQIADYLSVFLLTPFLLVAAMGATSLMQELPFLAYLLEEQFVSLAMSRLLRLVPVLFNVVAVAVLYTVMPNRRPDFRTLLVAALIAGVALQLVQTTYVKFQLAAANWTLLYGALAQIPVMMLWIYWSWLVILACAELAVVLENGAPAELVDARQVTPWAAALSILVQAAENFRAGRGPVRVEQMAIDLGMPRPAVAEVAAQLAASGFLVRVSGVRGGFVLAREPAGIDLGMLVAQLDEITAPPGCDPRVGAILDRTAAERHAGLRRVTLADILEENPETRQFPH